MNLLSEHDKAVLNSIFNPLLPLGEASFSEETHQGDEETLAPEVMTIVKRAIHASETEDFEAAFKYFEKALDMVPNSPSVLNDRAQALRLAGKDKDAMEDLNRAVGISGGKGKAGVRALCQRGILYRFTGKVNEARMDFEEAAKQGSSFARTQLVELNPYAAMCNQMLRDVTVKLNKPLSD